MREKRIVHCLRCVERCLQSLCHCTVGGGSIFPADFLLSPDAAAESTSSALPDGQAAPAISAVVKSPCLDSKGELMICCGALRNCA